MPLVLKRLLFVCLALFASTSWAGDAPPKKVKRTRAEMFEQARAVVAAQGLSAQDPRNVSSRLTFGAGYRRILFPDGPANTYGLSFIQRIQIGDQWSLITNIPLLVADNSKNGADTAFALGDMRFSFFGMPWKHKDPFETVNSVLLSIDTFLPTGNTAARTGSGYWVISASSGIGLTLLPNMFLFPTLGYAGNISDKGGNGDVSHGMNLQVVWLNLFAQNKVFLTLMPAYSQFFSGQLKGATFQLQLNVGYQFNGQAVGLYYNQYFLRDTGLQSYVQLSYTLFLGKAGPKKKGKQDANAAALSERARRAGRASSPLYFGR